jgi:hypothetical protein
VFLLAFFGGGRLRIAPQYLAQSIYCWGAAFAITLARPVGRDGSAPRLKQAPPTPLTKSRG